MNRINKLFSEKQSRILNVYCTAGYPSINSLSEILIALQTSGADIVEVGMPYSDPIADGPVIQSSNMTALQNGMTIQTMFDQIQDCRNYFQLPMILMGYLNPVMQFGVGKFCLQAKNAGVDGIILPDLPLREFQTYFSKHLEDAGLQFIFLITPETSDERIKEIDRLSNGFIYAVSSSSTTGGTTDPQKQEEYLLRIKNMNLNNPVLAGFGIRDKETFDNACQYTNGAIIGSAYINALESSSNIIKTTEDFIDGVLGKG